MECPRASQGHTELVWGNFIHRIFKMPLNGSAATAPVGLLVEVLAEQTQSDVAGEAVCSIVCYLAGVEKSPVLTLLPGKHKDFCQFSMLNFTVSICP